MSNELNLYPDIVDYLATQTETYRINPAEVPGLIEYIAARVALPRDVIEFILQSYFTYLRSELLKGNSVPTSFGWVKTYIIQKNNKKIWFKRFRKFARAINKT
jgi:hypothetical protein